VLISILAKTLLLSKSTRHYQDLFHPSNKLLYPAVLITGSAGQQCCFVCFVFVGFSTGKQRRSTPHHHDHSYSSILLLRHSAIPLLLFLIIAQHLSSFGYTHPMYYINPRTSLVTL